MINKFSKLLTIVLLFTHSLYAISSDDITDGAKKAHLASINTLLIFTSQDSLNSGLYHFTDVGVDMSIYHLPFSYTLNPNSGKIEYFLVGNVGYSKVKLNQSIEIPPDSRLNYKNYIGTYTAGLGVGIRYKFTNELATSAGIELIYSRSGVSITEDDSNIGTPIKDFFDNNYNNNISYEFFTDIEYRPKFSYLNPYAKLSYKTYQTKSSFSFNELTKLSTDSSITTFTLGVESNALLTFEKKYVTLEGYLNANYLDGIVKQTVHFNRFHSIGAVSYLYTDSIERIRRYFLEVNVVDGAGLNGYNIGIGFTIDY